MIYWQVPIIVQIVMLKKLNRIVFNKFTEKSVLFVVELMSETIAIKKMEEKLRKISNCSVKISFLGSFIWKTSREKYT